MSLSLQDFKFGLYFRTLIIDATDPNDSKAVSAMLARHRSLYERMRAVGAKRYAGFGAVPFSPADWQDHFGPATWQRLVAAKKQYDPHNVLTPGPGMFGAS